MAVRHYALGRLNPIVYFINSRGEISLPPSTEAAMYMKDRMRAKGWEIQEADTLDKIDRLQTTMQNQARAANERNLMREEGALAGIRKSVRDRLVARMTSSETTPYEREFIQAYLMTRDDKREEYRKRFMQDQCYFEAREMNSQYATLDKVHATPEMKDEECVRCHSYRRVKGLTICFRCQTEVTQEHARR